MGSWVELKVLKTISAGMLLASLIGSVGWEAQAMGAHQRAAQGCAAAGVYTVGTGLAALSQPSTGGPNYPEWGGLQGTVTLTSYTACGARTSGSFAVRLPFHPRPFEQPQSSARGSTTPAAASVIVANPLSNTTVLSATGTFVQDTAHFADPGYVLVSAVIAYGGISSYSCTRVCAQPEAGAPLSCPPVHCTIGGVIVARIVTVAALTGFLRWQDSAPSLLGLAFLPPPDPAESPAASMQRLQPLTLIGQRIEGIRTGSIPTKLPGNATSG